MKVDYGVFGDALAAASIGTWRIEVDEGKGPRMYADATMLRLLGVAEDAELSPEEVYHAWYDHVDPAHYDAVAEGVAHMLKGETAEIQYPWHHPDGRTIVVRCGGIRDESYTAGQRAAGIHQWVTTMHHVDRKFESQQRQLEEQRTQLEEFKASMDVIKGVIKAGRWYYHLDSDNRITIVSHNEDACRLIDNEYADGEDAWARLIHPDDREAALKSFYAAIEDRSGKTPYDAIFRIRNHNGEYGWFRSAGRVVRKEDGSGDFYGTLIDISDTVKRRDEASELDRQYERLLHETLGATRWIYTIGASGEVTAARYGDLVVKFLGENAGPMDWLKHVHPEDRECVEANFTAAVRDPEGKTPYEASFRLLHDDGTQRWVKSSGRTMLHEDGSRELVGLSIDITDTVEEQQKRLLGAVPISPTVLAKANIGLWAFELDEGHPPRMYHDETMLGLVGLDHQLPPEEAYHAWYDHVDKDSYQLVNDAVAKMMAGEHAEVQYPWHHPDGHTMIVRCGGVRNFSYTKGIRVEGTHQNVSEMLRYDEAEEKRRHELTAAKAASKAKTDFLFSMSHDIRTPMNAIMGFSEIAKKKLAALDGLVGSSVPLDRGHAGRVTLPELDGVRDCLNKIDSSGKLLLSLINSVLDMSRVESGKAKLEESTGDVMLSFVNIESTMQTLAKARDIALSFEFGKIVDRYVYADFEKASRVFVNLIANGIKYSKPNGYVKVRCEQVEENEELRMKNEEWWTDHSSSGNRIAVYRYTFEDNGIGMGEEFQKHVFEEFAREHTSTASGIQGTGLGLALCKSFVELMGGTIECRSKQGVGTTFIVEIPFRVQKGTKLYTDPKTGVASEYWADGEDGHAGRVTLPDFKGKRVLLAEDNELNREVAEFVLKEQGFEVESAEDGSVAVKLVKEKGLEYYDYILMDIQMPVMNGYDATKAIRAAGFKRQIIALSANAFAEDKTASIAAGMDDHVAKPIKVNELMSVLAKFA